MKTRPKLVAPERHICARVLAFVFSALCLAGPAYALDPGKTLTQYAHRIWGQEEGLFEPTVYSILQTGDGFLWFGTQDGLIRFDGLHFREIENAEALGLHRSLIRALARDRAGNFWIGSVGAGLVEITARGLAKRFTMAEGLPSDNAYCLDAESIGDLWVCTDHGLARVRSGRVDTFNSAAGLPSDQARATCATSDGTRWIGRLHSGLARLRDGIVLPYTDSVLTSKETISALACSATGDVWVGTPRGLARISNSGTTLLTTRDGLPDNGVSSLLAAADGSLWAGTNDGITRIRGRHSSIYRTRDGLSHSNVLSFLIDREGSLWAGTKSGVDQFSDGNVTPYGPGEGLASGESGPVLEDTGGRIWVGSLVAGLQSYANGTFTRITTAQGLADMAVLSLETDNAGDLWVGTRHGLSRLHDGRVIANYAMRDGLSGQEVSALFLDSKGDLWAGTEHGLDRFDGTRFIRNSLAGHIGSERVVALGGGNTSRLIASTDRPALFALRADDTVHKGQPDVVRPVDCYFIDREKHLAWMGTLGAGLLRWHDGAFVRVRIRDGLFDNRIYSILLDGVGNFWMASSKGIFRVSRKELDDFADGKRKSVESIPFSTGQLRFECQSGVQPAAFKSRDGRLWFSTTNGLVMVDPRRLGTTSVPPPVRFTSVLVNGQRVPATDSVRLAPGERNLEIRYAALSFIDPEKISFRYTLDGFDKNWIDAGTRREAFFTNLPPGWYRLRVMARTPSGIWSGAPAEIQLQIVPRIYQQPWFFPAVALLLAFLIWLSHRVHIRRIRQNFELVLAERSRIGRELHDTLLQGLSGITMQLQAVWTRMPPSREKRILGEVIEDAGRCSREARMSLWGLRATERSESSLIEILERTARDLVVDRNIHLKLEFPAVSPKASADANYHLAKMAQEMLRNAVQHANAQSLTVRLLARRRHLTLEVEDDGDGFVPGSGDRVGHFGLSNLRERAEVIGAQLRITSELGKGTCVSVTIPSSGRGLRNAAAALEHHYN